MHVWCIAVLHIVLCGDVRAWQYLSFPFSLGASIALENLRYLPIAFQQVIFNPICIFRHIHIQESPLNWGDENVCNARDGQFLLFEYKLHFAI